MKVKAQLKDGKKIIKFKGTKNDEDYRESSFGKAVDAYTNYYKSYKGPLKVNSKNIVEDPDAKGGYRMNTKDSKTLTPDQIKLREKDKLTVV